MVNDAKRHVEPRNDRHGRWARYGHRDPAAPGLAQVFGNAEDQGRHLHGAEPLVDGARRLRHIERAEELGQRALGQWLLWHWGHAVGECADQARKG